MIQRVGDRDKVCWSIKDYAFTIPANPMSDRFQMVMEIIDDKDTREGTWHKGRFIPVGGGCIVKVATTQVSSGEHCPDYQGL